MDILLFLKGDDKNDESKGKKKIPIRTIDLPVDMCEYGLSQRDLDTALEKEVNYVHYVYLIHC